MNISFFRRLAFVPSAIALSLTLAACGTSYDAERQAEANYLDDRGEYLEDAALTSKVASAIMDDRRLSAMQIRVRTHNNTVHLTGYVDSRDDLYLAEERAMAVPGVRDVDNDLTIR